MSITIPSVEVGSDYLSDPETEDCIWGDELADGMVVLAGDKALRSFLSTRELETLRWCKVTKLRRTGDIVRFIGVYSDGSQIPRTYNVSWAWYVKKDAS